jgi:hypothetical protein
MKDGDADRRCADGRLHSATMRSAAGTAVTAGSHE